MEFTIKQMREALSRFCNGKYRMCVPAQKDDDDMILSYAIDQLEQAQAEIERIKKGASVYHDLSIYVETERQKIIDNLQTENEQLKAMLDETETFIQAISSYRGQNLEVANWHMNGDLEPFDNLLDDNGIDDIMVKIDKALRARQVLSEVNKK